MSAVSRTTDILSAQRERSTFRLPPGAVLPLYGRQRLRRRGEILRFRVTGATGRYLDCTEQLVTEIVVRDMRRSLRSIAHWASSSSGTAVTLSS
jgi:hypothetical protein